MESKLHFKVQIKFKYSGSNVSFSAFLPLGRRHRSPYLTPTNEEETNDTYHFSKSKVRVLTILGGGEMENQKKSLLIRPSGTPKAKK